MLWLTPPYVLFPLSARPADSSVDVSCVVHRMTPKALFCTLSSFSRLDWQSCETQTIVSDAEYHTLIQQEHITNDDADVFSMDSPFLYLSFVDSACVIYVSILLQWIPRCLRQLSMTSPLKETAVLLIQLLCCWECTTMFKLCLNFFFFFVCIPQLYLWGSPLWDFCICDRFFNPTIKIVTFRLRGWCVLRVFVLPAFTRLGHERQDLLSPCDEMHVCTD